MPSPRYQESVPRRFACGVAVPDQSAWGRDLRACAVEKVAFCRDRWDKLPGNGVAAGCRSFPGSLSLRKMTPRLPCHTPHPLGYNQLAAELIKTVGSAQAD